MTGLPFQSEESPTETSAFLMEAKISGRPFSERERSRISTCHVKGWMDRLPMASVRPVAAAIPFDASRTAMPGTTQATSAAATSARATTPAAMPPTHHLSRDAPSLDTGGPYFFLAPLGVKVNFCPPMLASAMAPALG